MISKFRIGNPIPTDSVIEDIEITADNIPYFERDDDAKSLTIHMSDKDKVYGLGETVRGINKRGHIYTGFNTDDGLHTEDKRSLYASQNFFIISSDERKLGIYVDTPGRVTFDIGFSKQILNYIFIKKEHIF